MRTRLILFLLALASLPAWGGESPERSYAVKDFRPVALSGTDAVAREHWTSFEVFDEGSARLTAVMAYTVLGPNGRNRGRLSLWYDKFRKIASLEGRIIGADGITIRTMQESDIEDRSGSSYSLYEDWRVRTASMVYDRYPYTVEFRYELKYRGLLTWPTWVAQGIEDPVEHAAFEVILHDTTALRYWTNADSVKPAISVDGTSRTYVWEAKDLPEMNDAAKDEEPVHRTLVVVTAPDGFEIGGTRGSIRTWREFGMWNRALWEGRDALAPPLKAEVRRIAGTGRPARDVAVDLYSYLQKHTRYVSVQLGIGGWQPFDAAYVYEHGYGDCKALSNYMIALLKEAGIASYPVLIHAGGLRSEIYLRDFPNVEFNHVIVCVPMDRDSLWFECTSHVLPGNHLGSFTERRFGLLLGPRGGEIVTTPSSAAEANVMTRSIRAVLDFTGTGKVSAVTSYIGIPGDQVRGALMDASPEERTHWISGHLEVPGAELAGFRITGVEDRGADVVTAVDFTAPRYGKITGTRMFIQTNMMDRETYVPRANPERRSPLRYAYASRDIETVSYVLPPGYSVEGLPAKVDTVMPYAEFHMRCKASGDSVITYTRMFDIKEPAVDPAAYEEFRSFMSAVVKSDRAQAVIVRKP
jgi:transglutaminase-like putative cysteine protease